MKDKKTKYLLLKQRTTYTNTVKISFLSLGILVAVIFSRPVSAEVNFTHTVQAGTNPDNPSTAAITVPDGEETTTKDINLQLKAPENHEITSSSQHDGYNGWIGTANDHEYSFTYDSEYPVGGYYDAVFEGKLKSTGDGDGNGGNGGGKPKEFGAGTDIDVNVDFKIGDSDYNTDNDNVPWNAPFVICHEGSLSRIKAYLTEKTEDDTSVNYNIVPNGNACKWEVEGEDAGHGESLSVTDFPDKFKDDYGVPEPSSYNVKAVYPDTSEVDQQPLPATGAITLVEADLKIPSGDNYTYPIQEEYYEREFQVQITPDSAILPDPDFSFSIVGGGLGSLAQQYEEPRKATYIPPDMISPDNNTVKVRCTATISGCELTDEQELKLWAVPTGDKAGTPGWSIAHVQELDTRNGVDSYGAEVKQKFEGTGGNFCKEGESALTFVREHVEMVKNSLSTSDDIEAGGYWALDHAGIMASWDLNGLYADRIENPNTYDSLPASHVVKQTFEWSLYGDYGLYRDMDGDALISHTMIASGETHADGSPVLKIVTKNHGQEINREVFEGPHFIKINVEDGPKQINVNDENVEIPWDVVPDDEVSNVKVRLDEVEGYDGHVTYTVDYDFQTVIIQDVTKPGDFKIVWEHGEFSKRRATLQVTISDN